MQAWRHADEQGSLTQQCSAGLGEACTPGAAGQQPEREQQHQQVTAAAATWGLLIPACWKAAAAATF